MDSILTSIKKLLGIESDCNHFDEDIMMYINSVFSILTQMGFGPPEGFFINDKTTLWSDYTDIQDLELFKTYVYHRVKLMFDPPASSIAVESINKLITEFEWRIQNYVTVDIERRIK